MLNISIRKYLLNYALKSELQFQPRRRAPNNPLAHELESSAVIEGSKPEKSVLLEPVLANLSNRVKRGRYMNKSKRKSSMAEIAMLFLLPQTGTVVLK